MRLIIIILTVLILASCAGSKKATCDAYSMNSEKIKDPS
jgi:hypothetical protein